LSVLLTDHLAASSVGQHLASVTTDTADVQ